MSDYCNTKDALCIKLYSCIWVDLIAFSFWKLHKSCEILGFHIPASKNVSIARYDVVLLDEYRLTFQSNLMLFSFASKEVREDCLSVTQDVRTVLNIQIPECEAV